MFIQKCLYNACLGYLVQFERYSAEMAEQSPDEQRKLASLEEELLDNDHDVEICEADLKEAEKQLDEVPMSIVVQ